MKITIDLDKVLDFIGSKEDGHDEWWNHEFLLYGNPIEELLNHLGKTDAAELIKTKLNNRYKALRENKEIKA